MKRNISNIESMIEEREAKKNSKFSSIINEKKNLESTLEALEVKLDETDDPTEYNRISDEIQNKKTALVLLKRSLERSQGIGYFINEEEYKNTLKELRNELAALQSEHSPKIKKKILELIELLDDYSDEADYLQELADRTTSLYSRNRNRTVLGRNDILTDDSSSLYPIYNFINPYFTHREKVLFVKKNPEKVFANKLNNPDFLNIAKHLLGKA